MRQMVAISPYDAYRRVQAEISSGADLVLLLLRGVLRFLDRAQSGVEVNDIQLAHNSLTRAQDIISELNTTLNHEQGGHVAGGLVKYLHLCSGTPHRSQYAQARGAHPGSPPPHRGAQLSVGGIPCRLPFRSRIQGRRVARRESRPSGGICHDPIGPK